MKKVLQYLLICMMIFVCIGICGVGADEITVDGLPGDGHKVKDKNDFTPVTVTYGVTTETYTIVIPSSISFATFESVVDATVSVSKVTLAKDTILNVTVASDNDFKLSAGDPGENDIRYEMDYWLNNGAEKSTATNGDSKYHDPFVVLTIDGESAAETTLKFRLIDRPVELGTYDDVLRFGVDVTPAVTP